MNLICLVVAWTFIVATVWSIGAAVREAVKSTQKLHQIPCSKCQFFTNSHYLKCPVHPSRALTEEAINCPDYFSQLNPYGRSENI
ncbi:hypothetical protein [Egbenema bharatensis]|uniref:hypothetical protein n=1 Tax=Egbenema bharatensis TaxID=3463334 RepID=UPI003A8AF93D